jgi:TP901 family phage tail tape measure protein
MFFITSAGLRGSAAMDVLKASAKASAAGMGETKVIADAATSAMNAYGKANLSASSATDVLVKAVTAGKMPPEELAGSLGKVIPLASKMGVGFDQVGAAIAGMTRLGAPAMDATTALRQALATFAKPGKMTQEALESIGLSAADVRKSLADPSKGLLWTLLDLQKRTGGNIETMGHLFPNVRALTAALGLTGKNAAANARIFRDLQHSAGATDEAFKKTEETAQHKLAVAMAQLQSSLVQLGIVILPVVGSLASGFTDVLHAIGGLPDPLKHALGMFALGLAVLGPVLLLVVKLERAYIALTKSTLIVRAATAAWTAMQWLLNAAFLGFPLVWIIAGLVLVGAGLVVLWRKSETFRDIVKGTWDVIRAAMGFVIDYYRWLGEHAVKIIEAIWERTKPVLDKLAAAWDTVKSALQPVIDGFKWILDHAESIGKKLDGLLGPIKSLAGGLSGIPIGDVTAGLNGAAAAAERSRALGGGFGLQPQTRAELGLIESLFGNVLVTSGRRSRAQNEAVGGAPNSDHLTGRAFDIVPASGWNTATVALFDQIYRWAIHQPSIRWIGWRGVPGHGPYNHMHISTYDQGGWLMPGLTLARNNTGRPERVIAPHQESTLAGTTIVFERGAFVVEGSVVSERQLIDVVHEGLKKIDRRNGGTRLRF